MTEKKHKKQHGILALGLRVVIILVPVILALILGALSYAKTGVFAPGIKWNDEAVYLKLIETYSSYSNPLGYYGFDLGHAILGTGSAWSPAIIWPYVILYKALSGFGLKYSFVFVANLIFITLANLIFVLLTVPKRNQSIRIIIAQATSAVLILYICTNMSEIFRFSLAIVIAGCLYRMVYLKSSKIFKYLIVPLFILYAIQVYTFFAFAIPMYVYALRKEYKNKKDFFIQTIWAGVATVIVGGGSYVLLHFISSNYNIAKTEKLLEALSKGQILAAIKSLAWMIKDGLNGYVNLIYTFKANPIYVCHLILAASIIVFGLIIAIKNKRGDRTLGLLSVSSVVIFFMAYATLYTIVPDTFMRGTEIVIIFAIYLLSMAESKHLVTGILLANSLLMFALPQNMSYFTAEERYMDSQTLKDWDSLEERIGSQIEIIDSEDPWDNTVLMFTMEPKVINSIPEGMGINFALKGYQYTEKPAFMIYTSHNSNKLRPDWVETDYNSIRASVEKNILEKYINVYEDDEYIIYRRQDTIGIY